MCTPTAEQVTADGAAVGAAIDEIATAMNAAGDDPTIAASLTKAGDAIIADTADWQTGSDQAALADAEQSVIIALNLIPVTSPYAGFVAIAFVAVNVLIANSKTQAAQTGDGLHDIHLVLTTAKTLNTNSPWFGKAVIKHGWDRTPRQDLEHAWNGQVTLTPDLGIAELHLA